MNPRILALLAVVAAASAVVFPRPSAEARSARTEAPAWEYVIVSPVVLELGDERAFRIDAGAANVSVTRTKGLDELGAEGWELVVETSRGLVFKRPK